MNSFASVLKWIALLGTVIGAGLLLGWLGTTSSAPKPTLASPSPGTLPQADSASRPQPVPAAPTIKVGKPPRPTRAIASKSAAGTNTTASAGASSEWENQLDQILSADTSDDEKAKRMQQIFLTLPEEGQIEVAQHLSNLVGDENYASLLQFLTNPTLSEPVLDVLLADALNRPNSLKMPALLSVALDSRNPKAGEARDVLELFLEEDYGDDWTAWESNMRQWLRNNPD
jgi:hypothetical protein